MLGGSGFLGAHLVRLALRVAPGAVFATVGSRSIAPDPIRSAHLLRLEAAREGDLAELLASTRPAIVLNALALARADSCEREPELARLLNAVLPARLGRYCASSGARLVHVSTDLVFGALAAPPGGWSEEHEPRASGVYGETKLAGERALLAEDPRAIVLRLPLLYGDSFGRARGASDALLAALARGERPLLFEDEWRTPLCVTDAARAILELASRSDSGLLHVAGPERVSRFELGRRVLEARGSGAEARALLRAGSRLAHPGPPRPLDTALDSARARGRLSTRLRPLVEALRDPS